MKKTLYDYEEVIRQLPIKDKYEKDDLLIDELLIERNGNIEIYYTPHNEYLNAKAKLFIIGITPGFQQMSTAMAIARKELELGTDMETIQYRCKASGRFSGSLRKNIISMLDEIKLNEIMGLKSCSSLFAEQDNLMHTVSLIPYPAFVKKQNYTGHTPKLLKSECLMSYVCDNFIKEFKSIENYQEVLLIPLGKAVEEVLCKLVEQGVVDEQQILRGFPHPSGANVNRVAQLEENKESLMEQIKQIASLT